MSLQTKILNDFRQRFPTETLREIAALTDIQLTRVFRLMNGAPMKLEEYEAFTIALQKSADSKWVSSSEETNQLVKRPGLQGPIDDAFMDAFFSENQLGNASQPVGGFVDPSGGRMMDDAGDGGRATEVPPYGDRPPDFNL